MKCPPPTTRTSMTLWSLLVAAIAISLHGSAIGSVQDRAIDPGFGEVAREHIAALSEGIGARVAGSPGEVRAAGYIENVFRHIGYPTLVQSFTFVAGPRGRSSTLESANVVAVKEDLLPRKSLWVRTTIQKAGAGGRATMLREWA